MAEKLFVHSLICLKKSHRFSIETEEESNAKIGVDKMRCPRCQSKVQLDIGYVSSAPSLASQGRLNTEASMMALKMAAEQKRADREAGLDEQVIISPPAGERKSAFSVPKRIVESIKSKVEGPLSELLAE